MNVKGVRRAAIITREGEIKKGDFEDDKDFALQALSFYEVENICGLLKKEKTQFITMVAQSKRIILTEYEKDIIYLDIEVKYQLETLLPFIEQVLS
jgi:predicted regulator of Ras-like GTPase activity (Roadblock/LC7/MglB family)